MRPAPAGPVAAPAPPELLAPLIWLYRGALPPALCRAIITKADADPRMQRMAPYAGTAYRINHHLTDALVLSATVGWADLDAAARAALDPVLEHHFYDACAVPRDELAWADNGINLLRYEEGGSCSAHFDFGPGRIATTISYLNTTEGGETVFPLQGVAVRPEEGAVLVFPPHYAYRHEARPPRGSRRYVLSCWVHRDLEREKQQLVGPTG